MSSALAINFDSLEKYQHQHEMGTDFNLYFHNNNNNTGDEEKKTLTHTATTTTNKWKMCIK